jgi:isoprenylcysteine carboxyl methyltransferase (ICMT) family protein YpbQ
LLVALVVEAEVVEVALAKQGVQVTLLLQLQLKVFLVDRVEPQEQVVAEVEQLEQEQEE